ncbi:MAG TPA: glycosyltransferase 87 family protein [Micromonosporaceae bacterium]
MSVTVYDEAAPESIDHPSRSDPVVRGLSQVIGGPLGGHAAARRRFWTASRVVLALVCLTLALHWVQKSPCRDGAWQNLSQYKYMCYTDVLALYYNEGLSEGQVPYADHPVEYPVLTGAFMGLLGLPVHAYGAGDPGFNQGEAFYDLNALVLGALGVAAAATILALRRRRPWDAAMFALAPALFVSATVNWDLLAVALTGFFMWAWARRLPVLAGVLLGLAVAAKFYPLLLAGPLLLLALRTRRWAAPLTTVGVGAGTWLAVNLPIATAYPHAWLQFFRLNNTRGIDWGTFWYIGQHFPLGDSRYGLGLFAPLGNDVPLLNVWYFALFALACLAIAVLAIRAPRRPRFAQLAFLVVAAFLVTGKVWSQQYVLWLLPLAVLARPRWGAFLAWQAAELCYFAAFYGELMGASGKQVFPEGVFVLAAILRLVTVCVLAGFVVHDILRPRRDAVRDTYPDDPDGGVFDGAPDVGWVPRRELSSA